MKYMTPELLLRLNSDAPGEADAADRDWDRACRSYNRWLKANRGALPESVRRFLDEACLHDAEMLVPSPSAAKLPADAGECSLFARLGDDLFHLHYVLAEEPASEHADDQIFRDPQPLWLYDEIGLLGPDAYSHEILFSNGFVLKLAFRAFSWSKWPIDWPLRGPAQPPSPAIRAG